MANIQNSSSQNSYLSTDTRPMSGNPNETQGQTIERISMELSNTSLSARETKSELLFPNPPEEYELNILLQDLANEITQDDVVEIKYLFRGPTFGKGVLEKIKTAYDLFEMLRNRGFISRDNMAWLQNILERVGRKDLVKMAIEYAKRIGNVLYYYQSSEFPENGYTFVKVHVDGIDFKSCTRDLVQNIQSQMSKMLQIPPHAVIIKGIEPSCSMVITLMIPKMYVEIFREMLLHGEDLADLKKLGVDMVEIDKKYNIQGVPFAKVDETLNQQQVQFVNIYQQLKQSEKLLADSEIRWINLNAKHTSISNKFSACEEKLFCLEEEVATLRQIFSRDEQKTSPTTLASMSSLADFKLVLNDAAKKHMDRGVLKRLIDANTTVVARRIREFYAHQIQNWTTALNEMQSQIQPLMLELAKYQFFTAVDLDKVILDMFTKLVVSIPVPVQQLMPQQLDLLKKVTRQLRHKEKQKLKQMYSWNKVEPLTQQMEQDESLLLACLIYKELERTKQPVDYVKFISKCLKDVNRENLSKNFVEQANRLNQQLHKDQEEAQRQRKESTLYFRQQKDTEQAQTPNNSGIDMNVDQDVIQDMARKVDAIYRIIQSTQSSFTAWKSDKFPLGTSTLPHFRDQFFGQETST